MIIGIIFTMSKSLFTKNNQSIYYAETCANYLYAEMKNHLYNAAVGKKSQTQDDVRSYHIHVANNQIITIKHNDEGVPVETKVLDPTDLPDQRSCNKQHEILITPQPKPLHLTIQKNLASPNNTQPMTLTWQSGTSLLTGSVLIIHKERDSQPWQKEREIVTIHIDTRTQSIQKSKCISYDNKWLTCTKRQ